MEFMIDVIVITGVLGRLIMIIAKPFFFFFHVPSSGKWEINFTSSEESVGGCVVRALRWCSQQLPVLRPALFTPANFDGVFPTCGVAGRTSCCPLVNLVRVGFYLCSFQQSAACDWFSPVPPRC